MIKVSTHATFLKESYMDNFKPQKKMVLEELLRVVEQSSSSILKKDECFGQVVFSAILNLTSVECGLTLN
ncbi:hypothetical protein J1N35_019661 [Gossypium stocksii]|uniref:Uncharacterized protein n=1 Tax=Gossypium stocksii TaxID=47602 RepID=A0A9D3VRN4_9ROSI|nr:hypothetical protein J1N35_019661 [Gossypium stocksii]